MSTQTPIPGTFLGRLGLRTFTDRHQFERAAKAFLGLSRHRHSFKLGEVVYFDYLDRAVAADVWAEAEENGAYWLRGDDGVTYLIGRKRGGQRRIQAVNNLGLAIGDDKVHALREAAAA